MKLSEKLSVRSSGILSKARFSYGEPVHDRTQAGRIVSVGGVMYNAEGEPNFRYRLGFSSMIRRECDLEPLTPREVKERADFHAIACLYMKLRRAGRQYRGLCPFHLERDPSLYIQLGKKVWKCFGCGRGSDLFALIMRAEPCNFSMARRIACEFIGVAEASEPRSGERLGRGEGAKPLSAAEPRVVHSPKQFERGKLLARLDAVEKLNVAIRAANDSAFAKFERACEPHV